MAAIATFASRTSAQACIGIAEGMCEAIYYCWVETYGDSIDCEFILYDSYCNVLAQDVGPNVGDALDSELPYTVDIAQLSTYTIPGDISAQWWYAGGLYGKGASPYSTGTFTSGLSAGAWVRAGFNC